LGASNWQVTGKASGGWDLESIHCFRRRRAMHEAESQLSKLVALAQQGESVTIAIRGRPVAKLVPIKPQPVFALGKDQCPPVPWSAFAPMSDEKASEWGL
jgi:prevent-host-death family protein